MNYNVLLYLLKEGFRNFFKNKKSTGASLIIMCATMLIFGLFFIIGENVNKIMEEIETQQGMQVFLIKDATDEQISQLEEKLKSLDGVNKVEFVSKEDALNQVKEKMKDKQFLISGYDEKNPFSASYIVTLTDLNLSNQVKNQISSFENVKSIQSRDETITALVKIANGVRIISGVILILLIVISIFIIANTIKLTVHARRKEISIMKYVGATNGFIRWPFIVEGILIGIVAALISILLLGLAYNVVTDNIVNSAMSSLVNINLLTFADMFALIIGVYLILGIGIGTLGSIISMRKYLEV